MMDHAHSGAHCRTLRHVNTVEGILPRDSYSTIRYEMDNLGGDMVMKQRIRKLSTMLDPVAMTEDLPLQILKPDVILPSQFFERIKSNPICQPEKRLMLAVLEDAIATFQKCLPGVTRRQRRLLKEVEEWFTSEEVRWPFSFQNICATLELDADYVRLGLGRWKLEQGSASLFPTSFHRVNGRRHTLSAHRRSRSRRPRQKPVKV